MFYEGLNLILDTFISFALFSTVLSSQFYQIVTHFLVSKQKHSKSSLSLVTEVIPPKTNMKEL